MLLSKKVGCKLGVLGSIKVDNVFEATYTSTAKRLRDFHTYTRRSCNWIQRRFYESILKALSEV